MSKTVQIRLVAGIAICLLALSAEAKYSGGSGTAEDPYQIATADDLIALGETPEDYDKHFILTADIDLSDLHFGRAVIATFSGHLDGQGHRIHQLHIEGSSDLGLFGRLDPEAEISNVGLVDANVVGTGQYIGLLVGFHDGSISNCYSTGVVSGDVGVGGLAGRNSGSITASYSTGTVSGTGWGIGGLAGYNNDSITLSYSTGLVTGEGWSVGGLVGYNGGGSITICYSTGTVTGDEKVGGLAGYNYNGSITNSYSTGAVSGGNSVGGLAGYNHYSSITMSYSTGTVTGDEGVGGLVGFNVSRITMSYSTGSVRGNRDVGGLVGGNEYPNLTSSLSFWDMETSGQPTSAGGTGLTTPEMQDINTYLSAGWDFVDEILNGICDYWQISAGGYPRLRNPVMPEGLGTVEQPYLIRDAWDLGTVWFKPLAHYRLETSLDLSGATWSMAVVPWFDGTFDGNGHVISNLHIQGIQDNANLGLFGQLGPGANISTLGLEAVDVNGVVHSGGLAGENHGSISNCYSTGTVTRGGGLVGNNNEGTITACYSTASVTLGGGLVGWNNGSITMNCSAGTVSGGWHWFGGLVGYNYHGSITSSFWEEGWRTDRDDSSGLTTAEMKAASTFINAGWDFIDETANGTEDIWWIVEGQDYPRLWWEKLYVDDDAPDDPGPGDPQISDPLEGGRQAHPFDTIQEAIDVAPDGLTILVHGGVYGEPIDFKGKAITVTSGPDIAVLETPGDYAVSFYGGEEPNSVLQNFVIRNSLAGIYVSGSSPTIRNLTVVDNEYGIAAYTWAQPDISNCIFWNNSDLDLFQCEARYSCIEDGDPGEGNLSADPLFINADNGDYHLLSAGWCWSAETQSWSYADITSPCIDAGDPDSPLGDELLSVPRDPDNEYGMNLRINMGAYGGTAQASMAPLGWTP